MQNTTKNNYILEKISDTYKLTIPEGTVTLGYNDLKEYFDKYEIEGVELPDSLRVIEDNTFFDYPLIKKINLPEKVTQIGSQAFWGLDELEELVIPPSVVKIGKHAFCNCPNLSLTIIGEENSIPSGWDREFAANVRDVYFVEKK